MPVAAAMIVTAHASDAMVAIPFWLEMFAVVAASISGVLVAREHKLDLVGAVALAVVCGLGGGLLRDMTLQVGNVYILNQPMALPLSIATAAIIYIFPAIVDKPEKLIPCSTSSRSASMPPPAQTRRWSTALRRRCAS
ncbi:MAG: trimeric intracellular cation channel family protein [Collinsella sp.]